MKSFAILIASLLVASLAVFPTAAFAEQTNQDKTMDFMEQVLPIDLSKYTINLKADSSLKDTPLPSDNNKKSDNLLYELSSENSKLQISFKIEKGIISYCNVNPVNGQAITNKQYSNMYDAVTDFLKTYQTYTKIDSNNLITMLNNVDLTKDTTITTENTKLTIKSSSFGPDSLTNFRWEHIINGAAYDSLDITFDSVTNLLLFVIDTRAIYTIGDTSINVSMEQAVDIALENLKSYSYKMPDGSVVSDFKATKDGVVASLETSRSDYVFRPYWDVRIFLDEIAPGNVMGITVFLWANTGEIISISNMATGGIDNYPNNSNNGSTDNNNPSSTLSDNTLVFVFAAAVIMAIVAIVAIGLIIKKRHK